MTKVKKTKIDNQIHRFEYNDNTKLWSHKQISSIDNFLSEPIQYNDLTDSELDYILMQNMKNGHRVECFET